jgi:hypothetical protein
MCCNEPLARLVTTKADETDQRPGLRRQVRHADLRPLVVNGDSKKEADETFYLDLFGNSSNSLFAKNRGIGTIVRSWHNQAGRSGKAIR